MRISKEIISLILYPVQADGMTLAQKEIIPEFLEDFDEYQLSDALSKRITVDEVKEIAEKLAKPDKLKYFNISKKIAEINTISMKQIQAFAELGNILNIDEKDTGFYFNIYNNDEIINFEFHRTLTNFSIISSAIGFIPFIPVADFFILAPIQIGMVSKISNIYNYKIDSKEFIKIIGGTLGAGLIFKITASVINKFIPFLGWIVNASVAFAGTYAIGIVTRRYIETDGQLSKESIRGIFEKSYKDGKKEFITLKDFILEKKDEMIKEFKKYNDRNKTEENDSFCEEENIGDTVEKKKSDSTDTQKKPRRKKNPD